MQSICMISKQSVIDCLIVIYIYIIMFGSYISGILFFHNLFGPYIQKGTLLMMVYNCYSLTVQLNYIETDSDLVL